MKKNLLLALALLGMTNGLLAQNANKPTAPVVQAPSSQVEGVKKLAIDASDKVEFQHYALVDGELVKTTEDAEWIFSVRRYIFKTQTGVNGSSEGGAYTLPEEGFDAFTTADSKLFQADENVSMLGYKIDANKVLTAWFDYDLFGSIVPLPNFYVIGRDQDRIKFKIVTYKAGLYEIEYQQVK